MDTLSEITLKPGETFALPLKGRGSSGYSWSYDLSGNRDAVEVRVAPAAEPSRGPKEKPPSGSVDEMLIIRGISAGEVLISLAQRRSWEQNRPPLSEQLLKVTVRD